MKFNPILCVPGQDIEKEEPTLHAAALINLADIVMKGYIVYKEYQQPALLTGLSSAAAGRMAMHCHVRLHSSLCTQQIPNQACTLRTKQHRLLRGRIVVLLRRGVEITSPSYCP